MAFDPSTATPADDGFDASTATPYEPSTTSKIGGRIADVGISALKGAIGVPEAAVGLADLATSGHAGKIAEQAGFRPKEAKAMLDEYYSPEQKAANQAVSDAKGFLPTLGTALQNPSTIGHTVLESLPSMGLGAIGARQLVAAKVAPWAAGAIGEGIVGSGQAAEHIRQQTPDGLLTPTQVAAGIGSGVGTAAFGAAGGKLAQKMGITDIDTMLAGGAAQATNKGLTRRVAEGALSEGAFEELPQSMWEQGAQNVAMNQPLMTGVPEAGAIGMLAGTAMGGVSGGAFTGKPAPVVQPSAPPAPPPGPLSGAATAASKASTPLSGNRKIIADAATAQGVDPQLALMISSIETGGKFNSDAANPNSSARGLFQFMAATRAAHPEISREQWGRPEVQAQLGIDFIKATNTGLTQKLGREITPSEAYMGHLLGVSGAAHVLKADPNRPIVDVVAEYDPKRAFDIVRLNGMTDLTAGQAADKWGQIANRHLAALGADAKAFPFSQDNAQKRADAVATKTGVPQQVVPHPTVAGKFAVQAQGEASGTDDSASNLDADLQRTDAGTTAIDDTGRPDDRMGNPPVVEGPLAAAAPEPAAAVAGADGAGLAERASAVDPAVNPLTAAAQLAPQAPEAAPAAAIPSLATEVAMPSAAPEIAAAANPVALPDLGTVAAPIAQAAPTPIAQADNSIPDAAVIPAQVGSTENQATQELPNVPKTAQTADTAETPILNPQGRPFLTQFAAAKAMREQGLTESHQAVSTSNGFVVQAKNTLNAAPDTQNNVEPAAEVAGQKIDKEWTAFAPESGTLSVPRAEMPQIKAEHRGAMVNFLKARGIESAQEEVAADSLKPTQAEFSPGKVAKAKGFIGGDRSILVSSDNHVLDGHHQWMSKREAGDPVKVIRLNAPIRDLLNTVKEFPSAEQQAGSTIQNDASLADVNPGLAKMQAAKAQKTAQAAPAAVDAQKVPTLAPVPAKPSKYAQAKTIEERRNAPATELGIAVGDTITLSRPVSYMGANKPMEVERIQNGVLHIKSGDGRTSEPLSRILAEHQREPLLSVTKAAIAQPGIAKMQQAKAAKKPGSGAQVARDKLKAGNPFLSFLAEHGVHPQDRADVGVEPKYSGLTPGHGPIFKKSAPRLDILAERAREAGHLTQADIDNADDNGGVNKLSDMIRRAVVGREVIRADDQAAEQTHGADAQLMDEAAALGINTAGKSVDQVYDEVIAHHAGRASEEVRDAIDALFDTPSPQAQLSDEEIDNLFGLTPESGSIPEVSAAGQADGRSEGDQAAEGFTLASETAAEARAQVTAQEQRQDAAQAANVAADNRAQADAEVGNFTLTGSDRKADVGAAQGQQDIFSVKQKDSDYTDPYENLETRPGTTEAQRNAGRSAVDALARRIGADRSGARTDTGGGTGSVLGNAMLANFVAGKPNQLVGQVAKTPADLAALAQVYRDPRFETFRVIYMEGDKIVGEAGYTSRLPAMVAIPSELPSQIAADKQRFGASGYYLMHNHPSGKSAPSVADSDLTTRVASKVTGFISHVVIDHNEYAVIQRNGGHHVVRDASLNGRDFSAAPALEHALLGFAIQGPSSVAQLAKALQIPAGHATLVLTRREGAVQLLVDVPMGALQIKNKMDVLKVKALIRRMARETGSGGNRFIVLPDGAAINDDGRLLAEGVFTDVVSADGRSLRNEGAYHSGDFLDKNAKPMAVRQKAMPDWLDAATPETQEAARKAGLWTPPQSLKDRFLTLKKDAAKKITQGLFDQFAPIKELDYQSYVLARMSKASDAGIEATLFYGKPKLDADGALRIDPQQDGLIGVLKDLQGEQDRFFAWIAGNRAAQLKLDGKENLFTDTDITALKQMNQGQLPDGSSRAMTYAKVHKEFNAYSKAVLDIAEQTGIINGADRAIWEKDFYVPFYRVLEDDDVKGPRNISGLTNQHAFKKLKGGTDNLNDLLTNTLMNWSHLLSASLKNQASTSTLTAAVASGAAHPVSDAQKGSVFILDRGAKQHFVVDDPLLLDAISSLEFAGFKGAPMQALSAFKRALSFGVTISPSYRLRNLIRDQLQAIAANPMSYNVAKNLADGVKYSAKNNPAYAQMLAGGALMRMGATFEGDRSAYVKQLIGHGIAQNTILDTPDKITSAMKSAWHWWQETGDKAESITRAAIYQQLIDQGKSHLEASFTARDSMDFSLQGAWPAVRMLTQTVPFMNARMQGLYKLGRAAKEDPKRFATVLGATTLATVALMLAYRDDDDWKRRAEYDRDNFWWFKAGDKAFRIPKPFEIGAMASIAERGLDMLLDGMDAPSRKRFVSRFAHILSDNLAMNPIPQLFKPAIDLYANTDSFRGQDIESQGMERLSKSERISPNTSAAAQLLGKAGILSPVQIDFAIQGYLGWLGTHAAMTADFALRPAMGMPDKASRKIDDYFTIGDWVKELPSNQSRYVDQFYKQAKEAQQAMADFRHYQNLGQPDKAREVMADNRDQVRQAPMYAHAQREIGKINQRLRFISMSSMDPDRKREQIDRLNAVRNRIAETVVTRK